ncbi:hypothetical protein GYH30_006023 [Glycine max]|nr:hypothetical protein GYH30_006023 [Glycine max]
MKSFCNEILILSSINLVKLHGYYRDPTFLPQGIIDGVIIWWEDKGEATAYGGGVEEEHATKEAEEEHHDNVCDLLSSSRGNAGEVGEGVEEHDNGRLDLAAEETTEGFEFKGTILNAI